MTIHPEVSIHAALVLGSDSFRLLIATRRGNVLQVLDKAHVPLRLAAALDAHGSLGAEAINAALTCVQGMRTRLDAWPGVQVRAVATSTLRMARDSHAFLSMARQLLGHPIQVISGQEEGILTWRGATDACIGADVDARSLVLGIGGGSTQLALGRAGRVLKVDSLALGTARIALSFFPEGRVDRVTFDAAVASSRAKVADVAPTYGTRQRSYVLGGSGTISTLACLQRENGIAGNLTLPGLHSFRASVLAHDEQRAVLNGIGPLRLRDVAAALAILQGLMEELEIVELPLAQAGLRAGLLADRLTVPAVSTDEEAAARAEQRNALGPGEDNVRVLAATPR